MSDPYREPPMSDIDLLNQKFNQETAAWRKIHAIGQLKYLVDRWKDAKTANRNTAELDSQILEQISTVKTHIPDFSFSNWLEANYSRR